MKVEYSYISIIITHTIIRLLIIPTTSRIGSIRITVNRSPKNISIYTT